MSEFMFERGHVSITLKNGYRLSMTNYDNGAHCHVDEYRCTKYTTFSQDVEMMVFDPKGIDITAQFFPNASPDATHVTDSQMIDVLNRIVGRC